MRISSFSSSARRWSGFPSSGRTGLVLVASALIGFTACGGDDGEDVSSDSPNDLDEGLDWSDSSDIDSSDLDDDGPSSDSSGVGGDSGQLEVWETLPPGFQANVALDGEPVARGGWQLVGSFAEVGETPQERCGNVLRTIARDMPSDHPDFGQGEESTPNIVTSLLGDDRKPVFQGPSVTVQSADSFAQWYRDVDLNVPYVLDLWLEPVDGTFVFDSGAFFPLDELGTEGSDNQKYQTGGDGQRHRFLFTVELHTQFKYQGGETFTFRGDDDVFVYIDGKLAVNLGGIHGPEVGSVNLDTFASEHALTVGEVYQFDLFQAERKPTGSNFRVQTTLDFSGCSQILPPSVN